MSTKGRRPWLLHGFTANRIFAPSHPPHWKEALVTALLALLSVHLFSHRILTKGSSNKWREYDGSFKWIFFSPLAEINNVFFFLCVIVHLRPKQFEEHLAMIRNTENSFKIRANFFVMCPRHVTCRQIDSATFEFCFCFLDPTQTLNAPSDSGLQRNMKYGVQITVGDVLRSFALLCCPLF
jgi:hypothetical protein